LQKAERIAFCLLHFVSRVNRSARETQIGIAARLILRFSFRMNRIDTAGSKLCAFATRHARRRADIPSVAAQLAKGKIPRLIPLVPLGAACGNRIRFHASEVRL
jgi:hypothetical protein